MEYYHISGMRNGKTVLQQMLEKIPEFKLEPDESFFTKELKRLSKSFLNWDHEAGINDSLIYATKMMGPTFANGGVTFEGTLTDAGKEFFDKIGFTEEEKKYMENDVKATKAAYELGKKVRTEMFKQVRPKIKDVIFNDPATIVFWDDGTKTVVKVRDGDQYDPDIGIVMACAKKLLGAEYSADIHRVVNTKYRKRWFKVDIRRKATNSLVRTATISAANDDDAIMLAKYWINEKCMDPFAEDKYTFQIHTDEPRVKMFRWNVEAKEDNNGYTSTLSFEVNATNADNAEINARNYIDIIKKWKGANLNYKITVTILGEVCPNE